MADDASRADRQGWWLGLTVICAAALALRIGSVFLLEHPLSIAGDPSQYHYGANLLVAGHGFIDPFAHRALGVAHQSAEHPPLYLLSLALPSALGLDSVLDHQLWSCVLGTGAVAAIGLLGRRLAGIRTGLVAAGLAAVYPWLWIPNATVGAETVSALLAALVLLAAYRFWQQRSVAAAAWLGVACGLAALGRAEAALLLPLIVLPCALWFRGLGPRRRAGLVGVAVLAAGLTLGPWVGFNLSRFHHRVLLTTGLDLAWVQANCDDVFYGAHTGYYSFGCIPSVPPPRGDESDDNVYFHRVALQYMREHEGRLPYVVFARLGRTWSFYRPLQQADLDAYTEDWNTNVVLAGLAMYFALLPPAVVGLVVLVRRQVPVSPLVATAVTVSVAAAISFGQTRYRVSAEPALVVLAAVGLDAGWRWGWRYRSGGLPSARSAPP